MPLSRCLPTQCHVRPSSHPSNLRATKQPLYGLLQLNDWDAMTGGGRGGGSRDDINRTLPHMRAGALVSASWAVGRNMDAVNSDTNGDSEL